MIFNVNIVLDNPVVRLQIPPLVKGDTFQLNVTLLLESGQDITNWKIRAAIYDFINSLRLASANTGGSDEQILVTNGSQGQFTVTVAENLTTYFRDRGNIEVSVETDELVPRKFTILKQRLRFLEEKITWDTP